MRTHYNFETACLEVKDAQSAIRCQNTDFCVSDVYVAASDALVDRNLRNQTAEISVPNFNISTLRGCHVEFICSKKSLNRTIMQLNYLFDLARKVIDDEQLSTFSGNKNQ